MYFYTIESLAQLIKHASVNSARLFHSHLATVLPRFVLRFHHMFAYDSSCPPEPSSPFWTTFRRTRSSSGSPNRRPKHLPGGAPHVPSDVDDTRLMTTFPSGARADDHRPKPRFRTADDDAVRRTGSSADAKKRTVSPLLLLFRRATTTTIELPTGPRRVRRRRGLTEIPSKSPGSKVGVSVAGPGLGRRPEDDIISRHGHGVSVSS